MKIDMNRFRESFFVEAEEHLETMESSLLALENQPGDPELLNQVFRSAHTIKGGSSTFGIEKVGRFTHVLENLLDRLRAGELNCSEELMELLLDATDTLTALIESEKENGEPPKNTEEVLTRLKAANGMEANVDASKTATEMTNQENKSKHVKIEFRPSENFFRFGQKPLLVIEELKELGDIKACVANTDRLKSFEELDPESCYLNWAIELEGEFNESQLDDVAMFFDDESGFEITDLSTEKNANVEKDSANLAEEAKPAASDPPANAPTSPSPAKKPSAVNKIKDSVRVDRERLDNLINQIGELVIGTSMVEQDWFHRHADVDSPALTQLGKIVRDLQEMSLSLRMVPIDGTFQKMARLVRDLSKKMDKKIRFETEGEKSELDKTVVDQVGDPLLHMIRNSVDHGIETKEERIAAGKPAEGRVCLRAFHQGGNFIIEIEDDGRGLNREKILKKAIERGLISEDEKLSDEEINALIFQPGFSTAAEITDVSGRGVGMDVVRRNVESLQGSISIRSNPGKGCLVTIRLPLTLAILDGLLIRTSNDVFVIPLLSVVESIRPESKDIKRILGKGEVVQLRGEVVPLLRLNSLFSLENLQQNPNDIALTVIVEDQGRKFAIAVDELVGQQQVVIKNLETNFEKVPGVAGATILGDGRVALILDINSLHNMKTSFDPRSNKNEPEANSPSESDKTLESVK